jgi:hypothetical protein
MVVLITLSQLDFIYIFAVRNVRSDFLTSISYSYRLHYRQETKWSSFNDTTLRNWTSWWLHEPNHLILCNLIVFFLSRKDFFCKTVMIKLIVLQTFVKIAILANMYFHCQVPTKYRVQENTKKNTLWGRVFPHPSRPSVGPTQTLYSGYRGSFLWIKRPGRGANYPPPSSADVKERVDLYLYFPSGSSWPVRGRPLRWTLKCKRFLPFFAMCRGSARLSISVLLIIT